MESLDINKNYTLFQINNIQNMKKLSKLTLYNPNSLPSR